jgi:transcriptional regulator with XRE-family HTH domain
VDVDDEAGAIGRRIRQVRYSRRKSLRVIGELVGMSKWTLSAIERGEQAPSLKQIVALANALEIAPSELTKLPIPAPANGHIDVTIEAVRLALDAIDADFLDGLVLPVAVLRDQVTRIHNLHTTLATGTDHAELLDLAVYLHIHVTRLWLMAAGAPVDLIRRTVFLTRRLAQERDEATTLAAAMFVVADALWHAGAFPLGRAELDSIILPSTTADTAGVVGNVTVTHALAAVLDGRPGDVAAPIQAATELGERFGATGDTDSLGFVFGPVDAGVNWMALVLEAGEPDQAVSIAQEVDPQRHPFPANRAHYWIHYGRALARLRGRHDDAVRALRTAEHLFPTKVRRDPIIRSVLAELLPHSRRDAVGRELRGMAYRAGLPV